SPAFDFQVDAPAAEGNDQKVVFDLLEDIAAPAEFEVSTPVVAEPTFEMDLVPTSEFLKNLDVTFEIVSPIAGFDHDFFTTTEAKEMKVSQPEFVAKEEQATFTFDLPVLKTEDNKENELRFNLDDINDPSVSELVKQIKVNQPVQVVPMTEVNK